tara:strand:+ start:18 stop:476 length:459 start_codon:yes stop_codon:yes gene_type:complete
MKTFKEYVSEGFSNAGMPVMQQQWQDQDAMPSAETAVEALNAFVGAVGDHEYMNPRIAFKKLEENLQKLGYHFDMPTIDGGGGEYSLPLRYGSGTFSASYNENSYGEFVDGDGISEHIQGGISLVVSVTPIGNGKSIVSPEIIRNADVEPTE